MKQTLFGSVLFSFPLNLVATYTENCYLSAFLVVTSSVFWGIRWPILSRLLNNTIESKQRATIISVQNLANNLGVAIFSPIYADVLQTYGIDSAYRTTALLSLSTLIVLYFIQC